MYPLALVTIMTFLTVSYGVMNERMTSFRMNALVADVVSTNFLAYRDAVIRYHTANPAATGSIPDASLTWQSGYVRDTRWSNQITVAGQVYVYSNVAPPQGMVDSLYKKTNSLILVGIKQSNGDLSGPGGVISPSMPAAIPAGAIVYIGG